MQPAKACYVDKKQYQQYNLHNINKETEFQTALSGFPTW